jgi:DNA-binding NtrC family response regulator
VPRRSGNLPDPFVLLTPNPGPVRRIPRLPGVASSLLADARLCEPSFQDRRGDGMNRVLVIDQDRATREALGLRCLGRDVGVALAENLCEGVRVLLSVAVSLIVVDAAALRFTTREHAMLFQRVAPGVPVLVTVAPETSLELRVALELAGFRVATRPVDVEDLLDKLSALAPVDRDRR